MLLNRLARSQYDQFMMVQVSQRAARVRQLLVPCGAFAAEACLANRLSHHC